MDISTDCCTCWAQCIGDVLLLSTVVCEGRLTPMRRVASRRVADTSEIRQGTRLDAARRVAAEVSCFKMDRVVSLAL